MSGSLHCSPGPSRTACEGACAGVGAGGQSLPVRMAAGVIVDNEEMSTGMERKEETSFGIFTDFG